MTDFWKSFVRDLPMAAILGWFLWGMFLEQRRSRMSLETLISNHIDHNSEALEHLATAINGLREHCAGSMAVAADAAARAAMELRREA